MAATYEQLQELNALVAQRFLEMLTSGQRLSVGHAKNIVAYLKQQGIGAGGTTKPRPAPLSPTEQAAMLEGFTPPDSHDLASDPDAGDE